MLEPYVWLVFSGFLVIPVITAAVVNRLGLGSGRRIFNIGVVTALLAIPVLALASSGVGASITEGRNIVLFGIAGVIIKPAQSL